MDKIRFGVGLGAGTPPAQFAAIIDRIETLGLDSVWLSEQVYSPNVDPVVGLAYALSRTTRLKVGTSITVLPGRHPVLVAKTLASLAALAPGRVLPAFGLRPARPSEFALFEVPAGRRAAVFDESLTLLRRALTEESVDFAGEFFTVSDARITPQPVRPLDIWLGGSAPAGLRRVGQFADGWVGALLTPEQAAAAVQTMNAAATAAGLTIESDHFGISLSIAFDGITDAQLEAARQRNPDGDPAAMIATSWPQLHALLDGYLEAGLTKFIVRSNGSIPLDDFLDQFTAELIPRQN